MLVTVINAQRARGTSSRTGAEYDICTITFGTPVQTLQRENRQVVGFGLQTQELGLDPECLGQFQKIDFPADLDLIIEPDPRNINRNICKGIRS